MENQGQEFFEQFSIPPTGVGDSLHTVIMENNDVKNILTFDEKDDFKQIPGLKVFHARDIAKEFQKYFQFLRRL